MPLQPEGSVGRRVLFVQQRDSPEEAWRFRCQCVDQYRRAVLTTRRGNYFYQGWLRAYQEAKKISRIDLTF